MYFQQWFRAVQMNGHFIPTQGFLGFLFLEEMITNIQKS